MAEEELNKIKKSLRSVLISCPEGTPINKVESDYRTFMGGSLPYRQFGYSNVEGFLRSIPDTVRINGAVAFGVATAEIKHVTKLINNQRKVTSAVKRVHKANIQRSYSLPFQNAPRYTGGNSGKYAWRPPTQPPPQYKHPMHASYPTFGQSRPPGPPHGYPGPPGYHGPPHGPPRPPPPGPPRSSGFHMPSGYHGPPGPHGQHLPPPQHANRHGPIFPSVGSHPPPPPPHHMMPSSAPGLSQFLPTAPPAPSVPVQNDTQEDLIFSNNEIHDLLLKEKIPDAQILVHILSLAFPYIYRGSHIAIIELNISLCIDIATAIALDLEEELQGTPAILVVKMKEFQDFNTLESSSKVDRFNKHDFHNTKSKVITLNFLEMLSLLNTNNDHFYNSTTYVIFADIQESQIHMLNTLLPPELQYLFLLTCAQPKTTFYKQPYIMIRKWTETHFTDVAYNNDSLIEKLQDKLSYLNIDNSSNPSTPNLTQDYPKVIQDAVPNGHPPIVPIPQAANTAVHPKAFSPALKQLAESTLNANINLFIQAGPTKGKTSLLLELSVNKVDVSYDHLQIVLTAPNPKTSGQLFIRLKEYVHAKGITEVRAFGYTEGSFDKLNLYIVEQKVHILVIENSHLLSLLSKNPSLLRHCKLLGCDELYGSFYARQVPTTVVGCFSKLYSHSTQIIVITHPIEKEDVLLCHLPKPFWHLKEDPSSTEAKEKYIVTFFIAN